MKQEDKLKNTLRDYYDNQEVPFNDGDWRQASDQLNMIRRKRKTRRAAIIITIFVSILSTLFITLFNSQEITDNQNHEASSLPHKKPEPIFAAQPVNVHAPVIIAQKNNRNINPATSLDKLPKQLIAPVPKTPEKSLSEPIDLETTDTLSISVGQGLYLATHTSDVKEELIKIVDSASANTAVTNKPEDKINGPVRLIVNKENIADNENSPPNQNVDPLNETPQAAVQLLPIAVASTNGKETITKDDMGHSIQQNGETTPLTDSIHLTALSDTIPFMEIALPELMPEQPASNTLAGEGFFYEAGLTWLYGWKGLVGRDARGVSPAVGINYMNLLSKRCAFSFGLSYLRVPNLSSSSKTSRISTYEYSEQSSVTVITPSTVHYLVAPLRFQYYISKRHSFGLGANFAYLLNVDATVTTYKETPGLTRDYKTVKLGGYTEGFSVFDTQFAFYYRVGLGSSLAIQAEVFLGLTDVKQDDFFGFTSKEKNSGAKVSLIYYAFRKRNN